MSANHIRISALNTVGSSNKTACSFYFLDKILLYNILCLKNFTKQNDLNISNSKPSNSFSIFFFQTKDSPFKLINKSSPKKIGSNIQGFLEAV